MRKRIIAIVTLALLSLAGSFESRADSTWEYSVQVSATVQTSPAQIQLSWPQDTLGVPLSYTVYRRAPGATAWGNGTPLSGSTTSYTDTTATVGTPYEYQIVKRASAYTGYGYIYAGINVPLTEGRGKLLLVVDKTHAATLAAELTRLQQDLVGDGWAITRLDVNRTDTPVTVKNLIKTQYNSDPVNVKAVFLFGHVAVPYSGNIVPDGHTPDHQGAWPADGYYGDMDGSWTDNSVNNSSATDVRNRNVPGDGKFDQSSFPAAIKLMVGRVDLANMPGRLTWGGPATFPAEPELLRNYLNKDHNFRQRISNVPRRGIVGDYFGARDGEAFAASGWRNLAPFFGASGITTLPTKGTWIPTLRDNAYLFAYGCGAGSYTSIGGLGNTGIYNDGITTEVVQNDVKAVFTLLFGSWLGDWDSEDNIQRAILATPTYGLTCGWSGRPHWFVQHMGLGETIGFGARLTQNNGSGGLYQNQVNSGAGWIHIALMGDPTLRLHPVGPASNLRSSASGTAVALNWAASTDSVLGYHVYRANNPNGPFTRLTSSLVTGTSYSDANAASGNYTYMVRAVKLETSGSGTYYNPSQGAFATQGTGSSGGSSDTTAPTISISAPAASATISGTVTVSASASDNVGMAGVQFKLDGSNLGSEVTVAPYSTTWNTTSTASGSHVLTAVGRDTAGNATTSSSVAINLAAATTNPSGETANLTGQETVWFDDSLPAGATPSSNGGDAWTWVSSNPAPFSGASSHQSAIGAAVHQHAFDGATTTLTLGTGDKIFTYVYIDPNSVPSELLLEWNNGTWEHRAFWGADTFAVGTPGTPSRVNMGAMPAPGQWVRLEIPASQVGLENSSVRGMTFTLNGGRAAFDKTGKSSGSGTSFPPPSGGTTTTAVTNVVDLGWIDDDVPTGAITGANGGDAWTWIASGPTPFSGARANQSAAATGVHQHYFDWAGTTLSVNTGDRLFAYVYIDPAHVPGELLLEWNDGSWEHRAYWGQNNIAVGTDGTASRRYLGPIPASGQWTRLEVPASQVGLEGSTLRGMTFTMSGGAATWDKAGKSTVTVTTVTGTNVPPITDTNSVVGTNPPPVVSTNPPPTTFTNPPAASGYTNGLIGSSLVDYIELTQPKPGDYVLHVLSPTLLELKLINTKNPDPARVTQWDLVDGSFNFLAPPTGSFAVTANGQPVSVQAVGFKRRPLSAPLVTRDLRIENSLYLQLSAPISDNQVIQVKNPNGSLWSTNMQFTATVDPLRYSPAIHVNQEGYMPNYTKKGMVGYYLGSMGEMNVISTSGFKVVDAKTGAQVFQGTLSSRPDSGYIYSPTPYQKVYEADFTGFNTPGTYRLVVPGMGASLPFQINEGIAMDFARTYALGLYGQRCGMADAMPFTRFTHDACHTAPAAVPASATAYAFTWTTIANYAQQLNADNPVQIAPKLLSPAAQLFPFVKQGPVDVSGGHHDAGDYSKYTLNVATLVHYLMFAVDGINGVKTLDNLGIPESGDGISDVMQEAKWESDFLVKLQDSDGGFYFLVYPQNREYESNVTPDHGDPQIVYPKNSSATAASVAALAQCASSPAFKQAYPQAAALYLQKAQLGWQFLMNGIAKYGKNGIYQKITHYGDDFADQDELAWAACEMYLATGDAQYSNALYQWFPDPSNPATFRWGWWKLYSCYGNAVRSYAFAVRSGRLAASKLDATYLAKCSAVVTGAGDDLYTWSQQCAYGTSFPEATKHVKGAGWYFSGDQSFDLTVAYQLNPKPEYMNAILANMNYEGGCNPVNVAYVTGLGWKRTRDAVSQFAANDRQRMPNPGMPVGNVQSGFSYLPNYGGELTALCFPSDNAATAPYPFYDRWGDSWNVTTEFVTFEQARSLATYAFLAAQSSLKTQPWKSAQGTINIPSGTAAVGSPVTLTMSAAGLDLSTARITWEARDQEPQFGPSFTYSPKNNGPQWVEAEAQFPDGRRVFAVSSFNADSPNLVWFDDAIPAGGVAEAQVDTWNWVSSPKFSGTVAHQSAAATGLHQHDFNWATSTMVVSTGAILYAYAYLDPANPPSEIMLQWNDGTWEHRAYWGANSITWGTPGTTSRVNMGALPATGQWVQLKVPANSVGLEGRTVQGMGFSVYNGKVTWDVAGMLNPNVIVNTNGTGGGGGGTPPGSTNKVTMIASNAARLGPTPGTFTFTRTGDTTSAITVNYSLTGTAVSGTDYQAPQNLTAGLGSVVIPAGATNATVSITPMATTNSANNQTLIGTLTTSSTYTAGTPSNATMTIAGNQIQLSGLKPNSSGAVLTWPSTAGGIYRVAYKTKLTDTTWTYIATTVTATGTKTTWTDISAKNQPQRFYLIVRVQ